MISPPGEKGRSPGLDNPWERKAGVGAGTKSLLHCAHGKQGGEPCRDF
jgi:hypothetical protein